MSLSSHLAETQERKPSAPRPGSDYTTTRTVAQRLRAKIEQVQAAAQEWRQLAGPLPPEPKLRPVLQNASVAIPLNYRPTPPAGAKIAVMFHAFYAKEMLTEMKALIANIQIPADLYFTTPDSETAALVRDGFAAYQGGKVLVLTAPNRGRDIFPKLGVLGPYHAGYDYVLHLHTKKSPHRRELSNWREFIWTHLAGSPEIVASILEIFARRPDIGMIAPQHLQFMRTYVGWGANKAVTMQAAARMGSKLPWTGDIDFPTGSMFWARPAALKPLLDMELTAEDFDEEAGQKDGTLAHSIERLFFVCCEDAGYKWLKVAVPSWHSVKSQIQSVSHPLVISRLVKQRNVSLKQAFGY